MPTKPDMIRSLPICVGEFTVRRMEREDVDRIAGWPGHPYPYQVFDFRFAGMSEAERDEWLRKRDKDPSRIPLVADHRKQPDIAYLTLTEIDWETPKVGGMGFRFHPEWCGKGVGTQIIRALADWCFGHGIKSLGLDVSAANPRAVRCYEKVGFVKAGEFWRDDPALNDEDLNDDRYAFLRPHVRFEGDMPQVRFYLMELDRRHIDSLGKGNKADL